ncbi:uncharacterized protein TRAVEDRAFT_62665 [Trametes versicolor FP-101664 SS1]|uniref:uncharacterized protein n=1 Tax=Trametes versicolor (strain FP-101664) TaxID=717944 RepID=UPI0004622D90|nr:uncharacterized protein TRAVEDRAFT_62665 [Trametes versicolor FP-101664 SS1]EIW62848.1 hypothetical protein TRAVEDRAFT_62665 [Trametes versicolor FP-101664 SS1]
MLLSDTPDLELALDPADGSYLKYPIPDMHEVQPGVLATGQWTMHHPFVDAYLTALARLAPRQRPQQGPRASVPNTATTSPILPSYDLDARGSPLSLATLTSTPQSEVERIRWRAQHGGIASALTVAQVITVQYELFPGPGSAWYAAQVPRLTEEQKRAVFALAALRVLNHPTHPAHWALWAKNVLHRTAGVVHKVFQLRPCPIVSHVGWIGLPESVWALQGLHSAFVPPPPQPEKPKGGGMTLRKRKAAGASSANSPPNEEVATRVSPRKRQRTTRAQAAAAPPASNSMLLDMTLPESASDGAGAASKAAKQVLIDVAGATPVLQPLELALPDTATALSASPQDTSASTSVSSSRSAASMSPGATRRSNRARRKPAQGPVTLSTPSASTPLSALSTPSTSPAPLEQSELENPARVQPSQDQRARAGSCGSSTAVSEASEAGEASEGTVVDLEAELVSAGRDAKSKRKAIELDDAEAGAEPVENSQDALPTAPLAHKGGRKSRAKASARPRKRVKIDESSQELPAPMCLAPDANGGATLPPPGAADTLVSLKKKAAGGGASRRKTAPRKA